ncbi:MAG: hypothetical protein V1828_04095 [Candidatus Omnitrophota bacterium]
MAGRYFFIKTHLLVFALLMTGLINLPLCLAQSAQREEEKAMDERAIIKAKIKELEKVLQEKQSDDLERQLGVLKKLEETIDTEDLKAKEQRIRERDLQLNQKTLEMQQKRIKEVEDKIDRSLLSSEGDEWEGEELYEPFLPPEKIKEIEGKFEQEALYCTCRAALEEEASPCDKIKYPDSRQRCRSIFKSTYMVSQIIKNKYLTPEALEACR